MSPKNICKKHAILVTMSSPLLFFTIFPTIRYIILYLPIMIHSWCKILRNVLAGVLFACIGFTSNAQGTAEAWKKFFENDRAQAYTLFTQAANSNPSTADAYLGLSLLSSIDKSRDEAVKNFIKFYEKSDNPTPYLMALWGPLFVNGQRDPKSSEEVAFLKKIAQSTNIDGSLVANANLTLSKYLLQKRQKGYAEYADKAASITDWQLVGEFENISTSGFDKAYPPVAQTGNDKPFTNKYGAAVHWVNIPAVRNDRWVDFNYYYSSTHNSVVYAQNFVVSDKEQEVQLRIGVSGSVKVWVNDKEVISESEERNNGTDSYIALVKLNKGANRILVQLGESYCNNINFMLRLTDSNGTPIPNLTVSKEVMPYTKEVAYQAKRITPFAEKYFAAKLAADPSNILNYIFLSHLYLNGDNDFESQKTLGEARKLAPNSSYVTNLFMELYMRNDNRTLYTTEMEKLKDIDPNHPLSLQMKYGEAFQREDYKEAADFADKLEKIFGPDDKEVLRRKINLASKNKDFNQMIAIADKAYKLYPNDADFVELQSLIEKNVRNNEKGAENVYLNYLKENDSYSILQKLAAYYLDKSDAASALKLYEEDAKLDPVGVDLYEKQAKIYFKMQNYDKAKEQYLKVLSIAPQSNSTWYDLGTTYRQLGQNDKAVEAFRKSIEYNPANFDAIRDLRKVENKKEVFSYFTGPDAYELLKNAPSASDYPDDGSVILSSEERKVVYPSGVTEEKRYLVAKVLTKEGIEYWKNINVGGYDEQSTTIEKAEVVKANGTKVQAEQNGTEIVFTNLEAGDAINLIYKVENHNTGKLINHFWDKFYLQRYLPAKRLKYSLLVADGIKFQHTVSNGADESKQTKMDEFTLYEWEAANTPAVKNEDKMPALSDIAPTLFISSLPSWDFVSKWYNDIASYKAKADYDVKRVVADLFKDKKNLSELDKVKAIYRYILKNITYSSVAFRQSGIIPQRPSAVINTRIGDCKDVSTLFVALCKEAGIKANLVLVNTRDNGMHDMMLPSIDFNHCIAKASINGKDHYLELTSNFMPFDANYPNQINSQCLDITDNSTVSTISYLKADNLVPSMVVGNTSIVANDGSFTVKESTQFTGSMAAVIKSAYFEKSPSEQKKMITELISQDYPNVLVKSANFKELEIGVDTVVGKTEYVLSDVVSEVAGMKIFALPWSYKAKAQDYVFIENRTHAIDNSSNFYSDINKETITLSLSADRALVEVPANVSYTCSAADYSLTFKMAAGKLIGTRTFTVKQQVIPLADIPAFKEFYRKVIAADAKQLAVKKK